MVAHRSALLLAWLGAASIAAFDPSEIPKDRTRSNLTCFSQRQPRRESFFGRAIPPIRLEIRGWDSHVLASRMVEILLREKLGFDVQVQQFASGSYIYKRIAEGVVDLNVEAWPGNHKLAPPEGTGTMMEALEVANNRGNIGYSGQSGWFISTVGLESHLPLSFAMVDEGGDIAEVHDVSTPAFKSLTLSHFSSWQAALGKANEVTSATPSRCVDMSGVAEEPDGGIYVCDPLSGIGEWFVDDGRCCPHNASASRHCRGDPAERPVDCIVLISSNPSGPDRDDMRNRALVRFSGLPMQLVYVPHTEEVLAFEALGKGAIFYRWEGDSVLIENPGRFLRLSLTFAERCAGKSSLHLSPREATLCDFHTNEVHKIMRNEMEKGEHQDAWELVGAFQLSSELLKRSFETLKAEAETDDEEERAFNAACKVLLYMDDEGLLPQVEITFVYNGQTIVIILFSVTAFFASWVFLTGDDAYTSGFAGLYPNVLFRTWTRRLGRCACYLVRGGSKPTSPADAKHTPQRALVEEHGEQVALNCSITLGRQSLTRSSHAPYVSCPLVRLGRADGQAHARVVLCDGTAKKGTEFSGIQPSDKCVVLADGGEARVTFPPGERIIQVYIGILRKSKVATADLGGTELFVRVLPDDGEPLARDVSTSKSKSIMKRVSQQANTVPTVAVESSAIEVLVSDTKASNELPPGWPPGVCPGASVPAASSTSTSGLPEPEQASGKMVGDAVCGSTEGASTSSESRQEPPLPTSARQTASSHDPLNVGVGPVDVARVRLVDDENWPEHFKIPGHDEARKKMEKIGLVKRTIDLEDVLFSKLRRSTTKQRLGADDSHVGAIFSNFGRELTKLPTASNLQRQVSDYHQDIANTGILTAGCITVPSTRMTQIRLVLAFFVRAFRIKGIPYKVMLHQGCYFAIAVVDNFVQPLALSFILSKGIDEKNYRISFVIAISMLFWTFMNYHIKLNYFHGSMLVMQHLRAALLRKYLSLGAVDHAINPNLQYEFLSAISHNVDEVREDTWKGVFHHGLPKVYQVLSSGAYLIYSIAIREPSDSKERLSYLVLGFTLVLLIVPSMLYWQRISRGVAISKATVIKENFVQARQDFLLRDWRTIRRAGADLSEASGVFEAYWMYIREGLYVMWYHRFYTREAFQLFLAVVTYTLWAMSAFKEFDFDAATFVPLLAVVGNLGNGMQKVLESVLTVIVSSANVQTIAWLLNMESEELRTSKSVFFPYDGRTDENADTTRPRSREYSDKEEGLELHRAYYAKVNAALTAWEVENQADVRSVSSLLAAMEVIGRDMDDESTPKRKYTIGQPVINEAKDLVNQWGQLLSSPDDTSKLWKHQYRVHSRSAPASRGLHAPPPKGVAERTVETSTGVGCLLIDNVTFHHPVTHTCIFRGFNIIDLCDPDAHAAAIVQRRWLSRLRVKKRAGLPQTPTYKSFERGAAILPPNAVIGVRTGKALLREKYSLKLMDLSFCQMLNRTFKAEIGMATCTRRSELIDHHPVIFTGTLLDNLVYNYKHTENAKGVGVENGAPRGLSASGKLTAEADLFLWGLCKKLGMSSSLIGTTYQPDGEWGSREINGAMQQLSVIDSEDASKIEIVRAIFSQPDAIFVHHVSDSWPPASQRQLVDVLREYVDGSLDGYKGAGRTVLLCTSDLNLSLGLDDSDLVLTLESRSKGVLRRKADVGIDRARQLQALEWAQGLNDEPPRSSPETMMPGVTKGGED